MRKYSVLILFILLCFSLSMAFPCKADIVWSDNFDDGNYDGWYVVNGTFSAIDHTLKPVLGDNQYLWIAHFSTVSNGTWSFDVLVGEGTAIWLMYDQGVQGLDVSIYSRSDGTHLRLNNENYNVTGEYGGANVTGEYIFNGGISSWQHIDVTRNLDGRTCVYLNGTLCIDVVDHVVRKSRSFWYYPYREAAIDNIVVSNTVDIQPPSPPFYMQTWFIATVFTVVAMVVVIVVLLMRKKMTDDSM